MPTDTLESNSLKFRPVASDRLFYDRWRYCIKLYLPEVSVLRTSKDIDRLDEILEEREHWRQQVRQRWPQLNMIHGNKAITCELKQNIKNFAQFLDSAVDDHKILLSVGHAWIYTNSVKFIQEIDRLPYITTCALTEATVVRPRDVVVLKNSEHTHRSYFRSIKLQPYEKDQLQFFLANQPNIRVSQGLQSWLNEHWSRTQDYYFVDHCGENWTLMLNLVCPRIIRKTLPIVTK